MRAGTSPFSTTPAWKPVPASAIRRSGTQPTRRWGPTGRGPGKRSVRSRAHVYVAPRAVLRPDRARLRDRLAATRTQQGAVHTTNALKAMLAQENLLDSGAEQT